jgi:uncharacterized iron-regulated protein
MKTRRYLPIRTATAALLLAGAGAGLDDGTHPRLFAEAAAEAARTPPAASSCVQVGEWRAPGAVQPVPSAVIAARAGEARVVLLGETHEVEEHHRWQLQSLAALHAHHPSLVVALEMFPRRVQPALDRWVSGELDEAAFLREADWRNVWGHDAAPYLPVFHYARMNRIPMVAVNVERSLVSAVGDRGLAAVPAAEREGVGEPAAALPAYEDELYGTWRAHLPAEDARTDEDRADPGFRRFVEAQLVWDRAMAEGIAAAAARHPDAVVVALVGQGHVRHGWGVARQLQALGRKAPLALLPFDRSEDCATLVPGLADAVFGIAAPERPAGPPRPRLGITLAPAGVGVAISEVAQGSIAAQAGVRRGDVIVSIAGIAPKSAADVAATVARQAPGTWLPLTVKRGGRTVEIVARFPPAATGQ